MLARRAVQAMVIMNENGGTRLSLSTKALEPQAGDMLRNPGLVYEKAEEMAALFRERTQVRVDLSHVSSEPVLRPNLRANPFWSCAAGIQRGYRTGGVALRLVGGKAHRELALAAVSLNALAAMQNLLCTCQILCMSLDLGTFRLLIHDISGSAAGCNHKPG